jgi:Na+-translocating ferredoxin:NAD+ oxidoreductase subunit B
VSAALTTITVAVVTLGAWVLAAQRLKTRMSAEAIDAALPQTQCGQCGYASCKPYAQALSRGEAAINQCPPGGEAGVRKLSNLLGVAYRPLDPAFGTHKPKVSARIDEALCIGCTLCIEACPVDAILGAPKQMHSVITKACTGCELCLPPCPVDCIELIATDANAWREPMPQMLLA